MTTSPPESTLPHDEDEWAESFVAALNLSYASLEKIVAIQDDTAPGGWLLVHPRVPPTAAQALPPHLEDEPDEELHQLMLDMSMSPGYQGKIEVIDSDEEWEALAPKARSAQKPPTQS